MWKLNDTFLQNHWVKKKMKREFLKPQDKNKNTAYQYLWGAATTLLRGKFMVKKKICTKKRRQILIKQYNT